MSNQNEPSSSSSSGGGNDGGNGLFGAIFAVGLAVVTGLAEGVAGALTDTPSSGG